MSIRSRLFKLIEDYNSIHTADMIHKANLAYENKTVVSISMNVYDIPIEYRGIVTNVTLDDIDKKSIFYYLISVSAYKIQEKEGWQKFPEPWSIRLSSAELGSIWVVNFDEP